MKRTASRGFTLIELLVVIAIIGVLAVAFLPRILESRTEANILADKANLDWHYKNFLTAFQNRKHSMPPDGGHKFVLSPWLLGVCEHTPENRDRYFTPGQEADGYWTDLKKQDVKEIWRTYEDLSTADTHYAGRAKKHFRGMWSGNEALMADDNEGIAAFSDGSINVLMGSGIARTLYKAEELKEFWNEDEPDFYIVVGPDSPVDILQKLDL